jgi:hypothetical protein
VASPARATPSVVASAPDKLPNVAPAPRADMPEVPLPPARPEGSKQAALTPPAVENMVPRANQPVNTVALKKAAEDAAVAYVTAWSSSNYMALEHMRKIGAPRIEYFGKTISREAWQGMKRKFADKWPVRQYKLRPGSMRVECEENSRCVVRSVVDWTTTHLGRSDTVSGASQLELGVDLSGRQGTVYREAMLLIRSATRPGPPPMAAAQAARNVRPRVLLPPNLLPNDEPEDETGPSEEFVE